MRKSSNRPAKRKRNAKNRNKVTTINKPMVAMILLCVSAVVFISVWIIGGIRGGYPYNESRFRLLSRSSRTQSPPPSPSDLQLALFAHMAFFPFDFTVGETPHERGFTKLHYEPFYNGIMSINDYGLNDYGFNFEYEMQGWQLSHVYNNGYSGFRAVFYESECGRTQILSLRGTDGDIGLALLHQEGPWWCNFRAMTGERHSQALALIDFLMNPSTIARLTDTHIYITGHSLGGYLSYTAAYELVRLGFEGNIKRVLAFSAPLFTENTLQMMESIGPSLRGRIAHYYVPSDLIAGFIGTQMYETIPDYGIFRLLNMLLSTMRETRNTDVPRTLYTVSNLMVGVENITPFAAPDHIIELIWRLDGAMNDEALVLERQFRALIPHVAVPQTWHSERTPSPIADDASLLDILLNYTRELALEIMFDMIERIFDVDSHFMMNFYPWFVGDE